MRYYKIDDNILNKEYEIKIASRYSGQMYYGINKLLLKLQFNVSSIGFHYWTTAIMQYRKNYYKYNNTIEQVYHDVAKIHNTTRTRVERAIVLHLKKSDMEKAYIKNFINQRKENKNGNRNRRKITRKIPKHNN